MPRVSVLMPVHNAVLYVGTAIDSILRQTYRDFELIAIVDGATDGSEEVVRSRAATDPRIRVVSRPNCGLVATTNEALELARGEFVAPMDHDDVALPRRLEVLVSLLDAHSRTVAAGGHCRFIDAMGRSLLVHRMPLAPKDIDSANMAGGGAALSNSTTLIRTEAARRLGGYRDEFSLAQDLDMWLRLAEFGDLENVDEVLLEYRIHHSMESAKNWLNQATAAWRAIAEAASRRGVPFDLPQPSSAELPPGDLGRTERKWGWWALQSGEQATALHYALRALLRVPHEQNSWRLAFCALRGR